MSPSPPILPPIHATTIVSVRRGDDIAMGGDGQVTLGNSVVKGTAVKVRTLGNGRILAGFAGGAADAFALFERFESKLSECGGQEVRAASALAREWRSDRMLRRLEALLAVAGPTASLLVSGQGDAIQVDDGILAIGSGADPARAAAMALLANTDLGAGDIVRRALGIAAQICIYTNDHLTVQQVATTGGKDGQ